MPQPSYVGRHEKPTQRLSVFENFLNQESREYLSPRRIEMRLIFAKLRLEEFGVNTWIREIDHRHRGTGHRDARGTASDRCDLPGRPLTTTMLPWS